MSEWISVAERLPEEDLSVLGCGPDGVAVVSRMPGSGVWCPFVEGYAPVITHWMPLPEPPSLLAIAPETEIPTGSVAGPLPGEMTWAEFVRRVDAALERQHVSREIPIHYIDCGGMLRTDRDDSPTVSPGGNWLAISD